MSKLDEAMTAYAASPTEANRAAIAEAASPAPIQSAEVAELSPSAERGVDYIMGAVQSFASEWSLAGGRFDDGTMVEQANGTKARIRRMLEDNARKLAAATPAQPIASELNEPTAELVERLTDYANDPGYSHGDYADTMKQAAHCIGQLVYCVELYQRKYAESLDRKFAQPIADVSAPSDYRAKYAAENPVFNGRLDTWQAVAGKYRYENEELRAKLAARAAAPVSGPSDAANFERMFTAACEDLAAISDMLGIDSDIEGGAAPIIEAIESLRTAAPMPSRFDLEAIDRAMQHMGDALNMNDFADESGEHITTPGFKAIERLLEAAPVSGQGASIADDPKFMRKLGAYWQNSTDEAKSDLITYIDSRPRSEEAARMLASDAAPVAGWKLVPVEPPAAPAPIQSAELLTLLVESQSSIGGDWRARRDAAVERVLAAPAAAPAQASSGPTFHHPDDCAIDRFAVAMKAKMAKSRAKGRSGWDNEVLCPTERLQSMMCDHIGKGDPVDVGNFAMMLFNRGERTAAQQEQAKPTEARELTDAARYQFLRDGACEGYPSSEGHSSKDAYLVITGCEPFYPMTNEQKDAAVDAVIERHLATPSKGN